MRKLYEKKEVLFAVIWIVAYCVVLGTIRGNFGDDSIYMLLALVAFTAGITAFVKVNHLEGKYGLDRQVLRQSCRSSSPSAGDLS